MGNKLLTGTLSPSKILVDGKTVLHDAYLINDNNYFKLRDLATVINGTKKQF
jgi:V8-like Glu-specific endopeptidase